MLRDIQTLVSGAINGVIVAWVVFFLFMLFVALMAQLGAFGVAVLTVGWAVVILGPVVWMVVSAVRWLIGS